MDTSTTSKNGVPLRLTEERWEHIVLMHPGLADQKRQVLKTVKNPDYVLQGYAEELLAVRGPSQRTYLVVVYKQIADDGFIITAFETTDVAWLFKKKTLWSKRS